MPLIDEILRKWLFKDCGEAALDRGSSLPPFLEGRETPNRALRRLIGACLLARGRYEAAD